MLQSYADVGVEAEALTSRDSEEILMGHPVSLRAVEKLWGFRDDFHGD